MRNKLREKAELAIALLCEPGFLRALTSWPTFSVTSFLMLSRLARLGLRPGTVLDVGANIGQFAVSAAKHFPDAVVHSYEPVPECFARLTKNTGSLSNVHVHPMALGDRAGELQFNVNSHTHSSSALPLTDEHKKAFPFAKETKSITVPVGTLDREFRCQDLVGPVLLKLDVQGYEAAVLEGSRGILPCVDYVLLETSFVPLYEGEKTFQQTLDFLDSLGFDFEQPVGFLNEPVSGKYLQMDALFARRIVKTPPISGNTPMAMLYRNHESPQPVNLRASLSNRTNRDWRVYRGDVRMARQPSAQCPRRVPSAALSAMGGGAAL